QKYHGASRPSKTRRGRQNLSQQPQQQEAAGTSLEGAQYRPYPSPSKTLKDTVTGEDKQVEKKAGPLMKKMCKICGVKTSSTWHLAPPGEVSGVICDTCSLQAKLCKVSEKIQQRIGRRILDQQILCPTSSVEEAVLAAPGAVATICWV
ncbi:hypothetical protein BG006_000421, partial [Podila minutissima]